MSTTPRSELALADPPHDPDLDPEPEVSGEMTLFEHLGELRRRVIISAVAVIVGAMIAWTWRNELFLFILEPLKIAAPTAEMAKVHYKDLTEPFFVLLKTSITAGIFLSLPVLLWQLWGFVAPGLYKHEKRMAMPFVFLATIFFLFGSSFCYYFVMPFGFEFLFKFSDPVSTPNIMMQEHYGFALKLLLAFGAVFEMPVIAMFLSAIGLITHRTLITYWRYSVIASFVFAALLTPPDVGTQIAMAVPLVILYGVSIVVAWFFTSRRERKARAEEEA